MAGLTVAELEAVFTFDDSGINAGLTSTLRSLNKWGGDASRTLSQAGVTGGDLFAQGLRDGADTDIAPVEAWGDKAARTLGDAGGVGGEAFARGLRSKAQLDPGIVDQWADTSTRTIGAAGTTGGALFTQGLRSGVGDANAAVVDGLGDLPPAAEVAGQGIAARLIAGVASIDFGGAFDRAGGSLKGAALGAGAIAGGLFVAGVASGMTFDDARARLEAGLGVSTQRAGELGAVAGRLFTANYGGSLEDTTAAVETVVSSIKGMRKASDSEVEAMSTKALIFADVFGVDIVRATQVAGQAVRQGLATDAGQAFDMLTATMQRVPVQVREDVLDATDEYGGFFTALGIGGEQAFSMLAASASKGMFGIDKTGDALKEFTIRATDMSKDTDAAYGALGLSTQEMTADLLAGGEKGGAAFDTIVSALHKLPDQADQSTAAIALFGTPLEDLGTNGIPKFLAGLDAGGRGLGRV